MADPVEHPQPAVEGHAPFHRCAICLRDRRSGRRKAVEVAGACAAAQPPPPPLERRSAERLGDGGHTGGMAGMSAPLLSQAGRPTPWLEPGERPSALPIHPSPARVLIGLFPINLCVIASPRDGAAACHPLAGSASAREVLP